MPEPYSTIAKASARLHASKPKILLSIPSGNDLHNISKSEDSDSLGFQYLLGIFPFTRLYFEHGLKNFVNEGTRQALAAEGYDVLIAEEQFLPEVISSFCPVAVFDIAVENLRINAYDLLVTRRISIKGDAIVGVWKPKNFGNGLQRAEMILPIDFSEFRKFALAPSLSYSAEKALTQTIAALLRSSQNNRALRFKKACRPGAVDSVIEVHQPSIHFDSEKTAETLFSSYGFNGLPFTNDAMARVVQRGVHHGLSSLELASVSSSSKGRKARLGLRTDVISIEMRKNTLQVLSRLTMWGGIESRASNVLIRRECRSSVAIDWGLDGASLFALERALSQTVVSVMSDASDGGVMCN